MDLSSFTVALLNGLSIAMLLYLVAVGLTLIFGLMDVINLSHGVLFTLAAYISFSVTQHTGNFLLGVLAAIAALAIGGLIIEPVFLRPFYRRGHLDQVLVTLGITYVIADVVLWIWGPDIQSPREPHLLAGSVKLFSGLTYPDYRLFVAVFGVAVAGVLWFLQRRTLYGAILRAGTRDPEMVAAVGVNIRLVFWLTFAFGALLAGLGGALGGPIVGLAPGMDASILITSLVIVVVGGLGSLGGSFWGSILIGLAQSFGALWIPTFSLFLVYALMVVVLVVRPQGLLGSEKIRR